MRVLMRSASIVLGGAGAVALVELLLGLGAESLSWFVARAAGLVAITLLTLSVLVGVATSIRVAVPGLGKAETVKLHRWSSILAFGFLIVHLGGLLADTYVSFNVGQLAGIQPAEYRPLAVLAGAIGGWLMLLAATAFAWRRLLGAQRGRWLHRAGYGAWALGLIHAVAAGTDSGVVAVQWLYAVSLLAVLGLLAFRLASLARAPRLRTAA